MAALVTDYDLNVLGDGVDLVIKPPQAALDQMNDVVTADAHDLRAARPSSTAGITLREAEEQVLEYVREYVTEPRKAPLAGNTIGTDRAFLARDMTELETWLHYRVIDVSSIKELARQWFPRAYFAAPEKGGAPPRAGRHPARASRSCATTAAPSSRPSRASTPRRRKRHRRRGRRVGHGLGRRSSREPALDSSRRVGRMPGTVVGVAQLVEHRLVVPVVAGSSPVIHPR